MVTVVGGPRPGLRRGGALEDVFDTTGRPPKGWLHAVFHGGPYGEDVGIRVPGPPAPATLSVPLSEGGVHVYRPVDGGLMVRPGRTDSRVQPRRLPGSADSSDRPEEAVDPGGAEKEWPRARQARRADRPR